jgi:hypothetical protein
MTTFEEINNKNIDINKRVMLALVMLNDTTPRDAEQVHAAKCFLTYRVIDGQTHRSDVLTNPISFEFWKNKIEDIHPTYAGLKDGLDFRWKISQRMAEAILYAKFGDVDRFCLNSIQIYNAFGTHDIPWPPCILNLLRSGVLYSYYLYLTHRDANAINYIEEIILTWKQIMYHIDHKQYPYRFTEMRDDSVELQALMFILRACGGVKMENYDWMTEKEILKKWPYAMVGAIRSLEQVNQQHGRKSIWK